MSDRNLTVHVTGSADARVRSLARHPHRGHRFAGTALLAELGGKPVAAISLTSGAVVRDPAAASADADAVLRFHRYRILRQGGQTGAARSQLRRELQARRRH